MSCTVNHCQSLLTRAHRSYDYITLFADRSSSEYSTYLHFASTTFSLYEKEKIVNNENKTITITLKKIIKNEIDYISYAYKKNYEKQFETNPDATGRVFNILCCSPWSLVKLET